MDALIEFFRNPVATLILGAVLGFGLSVWKEAIAFRREEKRRGRAERLAALRELNKQVEKLGEASMQYFMIVFPFAPLLGRDTRLFRQRIRHIKPFGPVSVCQLRLDILGKGLSRTRRRANIRLFNLGRGQLRMRRPVQSKGLKTGAEDPANPRSLQFSAFRRVHWSNFSSIR